LLNLTNNDWDLGAMDGNTSTIPPRIRIEQNEDDTISLISNGYRTGFGGDFTNWYFQNGRFIATNDAGQLVTTNPLGNKENAAKRGDSVKYETQVVKDVGEEAIKRATEDDYAIV